jgi:ABC-type metal ion transport system substrate-binding protein
MRKNNTMKRAIQYIIALFLTVNLSASDIEVLVNQLKLQPGSKAILQWDRVFKSERKKKRYKINTLSFQDQQKLEVYLKNHAIDSDKPTVAGEI